MQFTQKFSRRTIALFWMFVIAILVGALIKYEQIAALYVLATVSLVFLLLVVAFSDLEKAGSQPIGNTTAENS
jgi:cell division protein FtsW (lipid II flippase)